MAVEVNVLNVQGDILFVFPVFDDALLHLVHFIANGIDGAIEGLTGGR